ncbi:MAG: ABC transporter substrate-binding protein [Spirochaetaceae bacterium]|jgi:multiple sugar transport system substrate-binding protein|nr:ABC transporter substrate-binding protein [Spirochaetaceae bacterium]
MGKETNRKTEKDEQGFLMQIKAAFRQVWGTDSKVSSQRAKGSSSSNTFSKMLLDTPSGTSSNNRLNTPTGIRALFRKLQSIFFFRTLWIWALALIAGIFLFRFFYGPPVVPKITTLVFAQWWEGELEGNILAEIAAEFEAANPGVTVILEKKNWDEIRKSLEEGEGPDIFSVDPFAVYELERASLLAEIAEGGERAGNILPVISFINPLFYNIELLRNAGFDRPPKNQTEFLSYALRVKESGGVYGAGLALGGGTHSISRHILSWIWASATNPESAGTFSFNTKEVIGAFDFLNKLKSSLYPNPFSLTEEELLKAFGEGKVGMMIGSTAYIKKIKSGPIGFGVTTIPGSESYIKKPVFLLTEWYLGINRQSVFQDEARQFAAFLAQKAEGIASAAYAIPGNGSRSRELPRGDLFYSKAFDMYEAGEMVRELYASPDISALNSVIRKEVEQMFWEMKTPEQCAQAIQAEWEKITTERMQRASPDSTSYF